MDSPVWPKAVGWVSSPKVSLKSSSSPLYLAAVIAFEIRVIQTLYQNKTKHKATTLFTIYSPLFYTAASMQLDANFPNCFLGATSQTRNTR